MKAWAKQALAPAIRFATRQCARVLMYHRFASPGTEPGLGVDRLDRQLRYLGRHFHVLPLRDLVSRLRSGADPRPYSVAITVDDAYTDFRELAYPVFLRHRVPVTLYVVSEFASGNIWLWWDAIRHITLHAPTGSYAPDGHAGAAFSLSDPASRKRAWGELSDSGLRMSPEERASYLQRLERCFSVTLPQAPTREFTGMDWEGLRTLDPGIVDIGAHTRTHPILAHCGSERLIEEVAGSKEEIESRIGRPVTAFCFPNGTRGDVDERCFAAVRQAGFDSAVMSVGGLVCKGDDPHRLSRMGASERWEYFVSDVCGMAHLRRTLAGRTGSAVS